jgi:ribonuclease VapC
MFIDASALTAIIVNEPDSDELLLRLKTNLLRLTSPIAVLETSLAVARILQLTVVDAYSGVEEFLNLTNITILPIPPEVTGLAIDAYHRFGKSRHPAALNMGDCFAYASARHARVPLLYKGGDFALTDIEPA